MAHSFKRSLRLTLAFLFLGLTAIGVLPASAQQGQESFETDSLTIETADGRRFDFEIELARTPKQRAQGLMFRRDMPEMSGMLFVYDKEWEINMWMKNTIIPLDMVFIKSDGRIATIAERTIPYSLATISSLQPVAGVLELNGGTVARLGIRRGDRVLYSAFTRAP
jgi:uncharacterized protein